VFHALYRSAAKRYGDTLADPNTKLRILCECEGAALRFNHARDVIRALILSERVWQDLTLALRYAETWEQNIIIRKWDPVEIDWEFRTFVFQGKLAAISQYAYQLYSPQLIKQRSEISPLLLDFYESKLKAKLAGRGFDTCVIDLAAINEGNGAATVKVIEINPFLPTTDGALFKWESERDILEGNRLGESYPVLRICERPRGAAALVMVPKGWKDVMEEIDREETVKG